MATHREKEAYEYMEKHKIMELMDNLTSMLFFYRPERPREFLIIQLEQLKLSKTRSLDCPSLFSDSNLDAIFAILDPTKQEYITHVQYKEALTTLGITNFIECPEGAARDKISYETFKKEAKQGIQRCSATFSTK
ncbi:EF-hand calcium-binding domain-containing protein 10 [Aplochiton taeniatus]